MMRARTESVDFSNTTSKQRKVSVLALAQRMINSANVDGKNENGETALHVVAQHGWVDIANILVRKCAAKLEEGGELVFMCNTIC